MRKLPDRSMVSLVSSERAYPGRVAAINSAMLAMAALSRHFKMEHTASAPVMKNSATFPG